MQDKNTGTVYVVSVSREKMYTLSDERWMSRAAENTQFYQIIEVNENKLTYQAFTVSGELYDGFELEKTAGQNRNLREIKSEQETERRFDNTLKDPDE